MLSAYTTDSHRDWPNRLAKNGYVIRAARHEVTGLIPNFINFGRELPLSGSRGDPIDENNITLDRSTDFEARSHSLIKVFDDVRKRVKGAYKKNERIYNLRHREDKFSVGRKSLETQSRFVRCLTTHQCKVSPMIRCSLDHSSKSLSLELPIS